MSIEDRIKLHSDRAMAELDLALRAGNLNAAQAHFDLSELHLDKMRALGNQPEPDRVTHS